MGWWVGVVGVVNVGSVGGVDWCRQVLSAVMSVRVEVKIIAT